MPLPDPNGSLTDVPCLPQKDPDPLQRRKAILALREQYVWEHDYLPPFALLKEKIFENATDLEIAAGWVFQLPAPEWPGPKYLLGRAEVGAELAKAAKQAAAFIAQTPTFSSFDDYVKLFQGFQQPECVPHWEDDRYFAWQRVAGLNPVALRKLEKVPAKLAVDDARLAGVLPKGQTLAGLAAAGRLFLCDYAILEGLTLQSTQGLAKYVVPAIGLFFSDDQGRLQAAAIQLGQQPVATDVYTPKDCEAWRMAKMMFQAADVNAHEMGPHLCRTHFVLEGAIVAMARTLSVRHPVAVLLKPHLRYVVFNNMEGRELLINPAGVGTELLAGGAPGNKQLLARSYSGYPQAHVEPWSIEDWDHPSELRSRGFDKNSALKEYPFRDDGMLLWDAIGTFVSQYIDVYYASDAEVAGDSELQDWMVELTSAAGAHLKGAPDRLGSRDQLAQLLQRIVWASGPLHSALNYPQYGQLAFAPNMALAMYGPPLSNATGQSATLLKTYMVRGLLPPPLSALRQLSAMYTLAIYHFDQLGQYQPGDFTDPRVNGVIGQLQETLKQAESQITLRNAQRPWLYEYLVPSHVLNSTSI
ncbi:lipoxygenase family protein [Archangium violaceum]|uniref:lipoxygenase family protein n=1 Tax=Archangium violaceum TaxID=83451 RepID=UPI002B2A68AC|nr:lipoxygenase family protein [Archangium gephyra]